MKRKVIIRNRGVSYNNSTVEVQRIRKLDECEGGGHTASHKSGPMTGSCRPHFRTEKLRFETQALS